MEAYLKGYIDGLSAFAWWKDGIQYVGTSGTTLKEAIEKAKKGKLFNFDPITDPLPPGIQEALNSGDGSYRP